MCSDGLFNEVSAPELVAVLGSSPGPAGAAAELVERAKANGGSDNVTVVVADVH